MRPSVPHRDACFDNHPDVPRGLATLYGGPRDLIVAVDNSLGEHPVYGSLTPSAMSWMNGVTSMTRRPLVGFAALCAAFLLAACNASVEAGRVTPSPSPLTTPSTSTPPASSPPTPPAQTEEETKAIAGAKARYIAARGAVDKVMNEPLKSSRAPLERAGLGGSWLITVIGEVRFHRDNGWYQSGAVRIASLAVESVMLGGEQPEVRLVSCIDSSKTTTRFQENGKPVPMGPGNGSRHKFRARLVFAPPAAKQAKMWFVIEEKTTGSC
jgi:hypothetical protein